MTLAVAVSPQVSVEGTVQEVIYKKALPKVIVLETAGRLLWIKLKKSLRQEFHPHPRVGDRLRIYGDRCYKGSDTAYYCKAHHLEFLAVSQPPVSVAARPCKVLVCQKSSCCRRGAKQLWQELQQEAIAQELPICLKATGCLGECKRGPAVVVLPLKKRVTHANAEQIKALVQQQATLNS